MPGHQAKVERPSGVTRDALNTEATIYTQIYSGPFLIELLSDGVPLDSAGRPIVVADHVGRAPIGCDVEVGDRVTCTQSTDPRQVGRIYTVAYVESQGYAVDRQTLLKGVDQIVTGR
ncbi:MAG: hypothetical protein HZY73_11300 [Micropruina sp.]|nr:MAG: hypothetical protein HZY73_11300 [Micropruina sp.]